MAMTDETSAQIRDKRTDFMVTHRESYLRSGGAEGHIMDITAVGGHPFTTHCMIKYTGRKSGKIFITPLIYGDIGGEVVIVASKGGADHHPAWYLNIIDRPEVEFQIATQAFRGTWREPVGAEYKKIWDFMVDVFPSYANYQASTTRKIPLVMMKPTAPIAVFKESDATGAREF
jgi:deazaflavin-dependent oxidoreductase (nitroreductase family)